MGKSFPFAPAQLLQNWKLIDLLKMKIPCDPGIPPQGTHPTETHAYLQQNLSMITPTEAVLMTAPNWTLHTCPPTAEWMEWMMKWW